MIVGAITIAIDSTSPAYYGAILLLLAGLCILGFLEEWSIG